MNRTRIAALATAGIAGPGLALETKAAGDPPAASTTEVKDALAALGKANKEFQETVTAEIAEIKKLGAATPETTDKLEKLNADLSALSKKVDDFRLAEKRPQLTLPNGEKREMTEAEVKHREAVVAYVTKGNETGFDAAEVKALSVGSDPDGGYTITPEMDRNISRVLSEVSPIRAIANVVSVTGSSFKRLINVGGTGSGWVGETESRPQTDTSQLRERNYPVHEIYANPAATQTFLDDATFDVEAWIADEVQTEFAEEEGLAFIMGDGVAKPRGFIGGYTPVANAAFTEAGGAPGYVFTGDSDNFLSTADGDEENNLIDLITALKSGYRTGARFVMNGATLGAVRKFRDADGRAFWQPSTQAGQPSMLLGYGVTEAEDMPDIGADAFPVAFGNFNLGYQIVDRIGTRILRDPYTAKPFVLFYTTKRVGGGIRMAEAIKLLKMATS